MGIFIKADNFFSICAYTSGRNGVAPKPRIRGAQASLQERNREVGVAKSLKEGSYRLAVGCRIRLEHDHIVKVGRHLLQTFNVVVKLP